MDLFTHAESKRLRDTGMALASDAEGEAFASAAYALILNLASKQPRVHIDDYLAVCGQLRPQHPNALGAVWMRAIRQHVLTHSGTVRPCLIDARKHRHNYPVYLSLIYNREFQNNT